MFVVAYLLAITVANLAVVTFGPSITPYTAFLLIGLDLSVRDKLHEQWHGRHLWPRMFALIAAGGLLSWLVNGAAGRIAIASCIAFAAAGAVDALVYHLMRREPWHVKVNGSNVVSAAGDSVIFPSIAFGALLPVVIAGQFVAKVAGGALWSWVLGQRRVRRAAG
jgi:hypothetical protein